MRGKGGVGIRRGKKEGVKKAINSEPTHWGKGWKGQGEDGM